jgi:hypothetical protein
VKTCETCKFWDRSSDDYRTHHRLGLGACTAVVMFWDSTEWDENGEQVFSERAKDVMAFVQDGSDYKAYLYTRPQFGCVSHEVKP